MGRIYSVEFEFIAEAGDVDFFELIPGDDNPCSIVAAFITQATEFGDAAEEMLRYRIIRGHTANGTGGTVATPRPLDPGDVAASFTCDTMNSGIATGGTPVFLHSGTFNVRTGLEYIPPPEMRVKVQQPDLSLILRLMAAPTDSITFSGTLYVEEH